MDIGAPDGSSVTAPGETRRSTVRRSATVSAWTLVSRVTGLLRVVVIGAVLGPTFFANTFLSTNTVPSLIYSAVAGPVLVMVVVPMIVRTLAERGRAAADQLLGRVGGMLLLASTAAAAALVLISPLLAWTLTLGVPEADRGRAQMLTVLMVLVMAPQVVLYTLAALGAAAQQARGRFALAAAAPAMENIGLIATMAVVWLVFPPGLEVAGIPVGAVAVLAVGATGSVALHAGVQVWGTARVGLSLRPRRGWRADPAAREMATTLRRSVAVAVYPSAGFYVLLAMAASVAGGVLVIQVAHAVYGVAAALGARAVATAVLPGLATAAADGDPRRYAAAWRQALSFASTTALPAVLLLVAFAAPAAAVLSAGEVGAPAMVGSLAAYITVLAVAQLPCGVHEVGRQALFARVDTRGPRAAGAAMFVAMVLVGTVAMLTTPAGQPRLVGIAVALLVADTAAAAVVLGRLHRIIRPDRLVDGARALVTTVAGAAMVPAVAAALWIIGRSSGGAFADLVVITPLAAVALGLYALVVLVLGRRVDRRSASRPIAASGAVAS